MMTAAKPAGARLLRAIVFVAAVSCAGDQGPGPPTNFALIAGSAVTTIRSGVPLETDIAVQLRDARGKNVTRAGILVTVHVDSATVTGGTIATDRSGQARFTNLRVNGRAGSRTLSFSASDATLSVPLALHVMLAAGLPAQLAVVRALPTQVQSVAPVTPAPSAQLRDADGNDAPQAGITVTAAVAGATIAGGTVATDAQGTATFSTISISGAPGSHTLALSAAGVAPPPGIAFVLYNRPVSLALDVAPPPTVASGFIVTPPPVVSLRDSTGAVVALAGVAIGVSTTAPGVVLQGTSATTDPTGLATFTQLGVTGVEGPLPLTFQASGLAGVTAPPAALGPPDASIAPASLEFGTGASKILVADPAQSLSLPLVTILNAAGGTVSGAIVNYSARSTAVARIGDDGRVTGGESGRTTIVASADAAPGVKDSVACTSPEARADRCCSPTSPHSRSRPARRSTFACQIDTRTSGPSRP